MSELNRCPQCNSIMDQDPECGDRFCPNCEIEEE